MKTVLLNIVAVVAGIVLGGVVNMALVMAGPQLIPPPAGVDVTDAKSLIESIHLLEPRHFLFPFLAHALGTFAGALTVNVLAANRRLFLTATMGFFNLAGGIAAAFLIPAPAWFIAFDLVLGYLPMAWLAFKLGSRIRPLDPQAGTAA